jgi:RecA-family ATPase
VTRATEDDALTVVRAADLDDGDTLPRWLVDSLWARAAVGVLGGAPKCCKSWLALDLAVSVASGTSCLGAFTFDVDDAGPVLLYMAEDAAPVVKARLTGICRARKLDLAAVPIHVITVPALRLDRGRDQARLRDAVRCFAPRLLVLDPFVRLHRIDENDAGEVSALLGYLRTLQRQHDVAVLVVHHARKNGGGGAQAGQSLRGSGDFHAWGDSNLYVRRQKDALVLTIEHRAAAAPEPLRLQLVAGDDAFVHLAIIATDLPVENEAPRDLDPLVLAALRRAGRALSRSQLRAELRVRNERLGDALVRLVATGALIRDGDRWAVPVPTP